MLDSLISVHEDIRESLEHLPLHTPGQVVAYDQLAVTNYCCNILAWANGDCTMIEALRSDIYDRVNVKVRQRSFERSMKKK
jgi:hypothetical protein